MQLLHRRLHFRNTAWTPAQPTTEGGMLPTGWWDAAAMTGFTDNDPVGAVGYSWLDRTANHYDAIQIAVPSLRPLYKPGVRNGLPIVRFAASGLVIPPIAYPASNTFFVCADDSISAGRLQGLGNINGERYTLLSLGGTFYIRTSDGTNLIRTMPVGSRSWRIITTSTANASSAPGMRINSATQDLSVAHNFAAGNFTQLGATNVQYSTADMGEVLFYAAALSPGALLQVETYLAQKWAC